ncbi:hypothetical protein [Pseudofulvibacter geojedonensis]|uniref:Uncharacterized protein n=1 Tax=Pseudofulvibacter geojedonensis TaxID=1123758 RepID=A0ABW3I228_9FLAO
MSVFRNNERKYGSANRRFKHEVLKESGAKQFPLYGLDFLIRFLSRIAEHITNTYKYRYRISE